MSLLYKPWYYVFFYKQINYGDTKLTRKAAVNIANNQNNYIIVYIDKIDDKSIITIAVSKQITNKYKANDIALYLCKNINAKGGGNNISAQVSTKNTSSRWALYISILEALFTISWKNIK